MAQHYRASLSATRLLLGAALLLCMTGSAYAAVWSDVSETAIAPAGTRTVEPDRFRTVNVDFDALGTLLARAPMEGTAAATSAPLRFELPFPDGTTTVLSVVESPVMAPELGAQYPEIRTYLGRGVKDPSIFARLDRTPHGFHAIVFTPEGSIYIDPYQRNDVENYIVYAKRDAPRPDGFECQVIDEDGMAEEVKALIRSGAVVGHGTQLRTYRLAVGATGEYTAFHGGTVPLGLAAINTCMNRVNGVYEKDLSIRMVLVPNNNLIVYTNSATDPYSNFDGFAMLNQNQANIDLVIGSANYDIGHVFSTGGGGVASLAVVCRAGLKARGVTGLPTPIGDVFAIDYVAHEMGHQYGGNHSFNGTAGACSGGNRNAATAYEPGSGSTIMAYAGICPGQDLQPNSDDYFHWISIQEIINYTTVGLGNGCPVTTNTGVIVPTISAPVGGFTIPISTPFALTATSTTTGTATYCWEESDLGPAGHPNFPSGNAPIFRSFDPVASPTRTFPKLSDILNNIQVLGEIMPSYTRNLSFKVTVRDAQAGGVGVENSSILFSVTNTAGPFTITAPNTAGIVWQGTSLQNVTWNVANTTLAPVSVPTVNILLSTDGGQTFPTTLAAATANDGTEQIVVPNIATSQGRVKVEAVANVFFDINNFNFQITTVAAIDAADAAGAAGQLVLRDNRPNPFNPQTQISFDLPSAGPASLRVYDLSGRLVATLVDATLTSGAHSATWDGTDLHGQAVASGVYLYELRAGASRETRRMTLLK
jgi:Metallo-peptidase family M12B Reprolysin-like/FlgD Ig-like domain